MLRPGGRFAVSDVIADPDMDDATRADMAEWTGCIAGALTDASSHRRSPTAGLDDVEIRETHRVHEHAGAAIIRATKPEAAPRVNPIRVGINGFGRMGRLALRAGWRAPEIEFVHVNELHGDAGDRGAPADVRLGARPLGPRRPTATATRCAIDGATSPTATRRHPAGAVGRARHRRRARVHRAGSGRSTRSRRTSSAACGRSIVAAPVKDDRR